MRAFTTRPEIRGTFGVVASTHWIASAVGMSILEKGGNAFDAAAAAGFTLQVVEPHLNGPLGEAPILVWSEANRRCEMICGQGVAPAAATIARFRELGLDLIPGTGLLAAAVPAAFGAWMRLLRDYGTMPLAEILGPAIGYAENGYPAVHQIGMTVATVAELFRREWPSSAAIYLPNGAPPEPGRLFRNPALAATYRRILSEAADGGREGQIERARQAWYRGFVAEAIDRFCRHREGARRFRTPSWRALDRRRHGALGGPGRGAADLRLSRLHRGQGRSVEPGAGSAAAIGAAPRLRSRRSRSARGRFRPYRRRMRQARLRRPRGLVRRSRFCRRADAHLARRRLQRCETQARRPSAPRWNCGRAAPMAACRACWSAGWSWLRPGPGSASRQSAASASRPSPSTASSPATPAMSMSSTAGATWFRRRRAAAGCRARRLSRSSAVCLGTRMQMFWLEEGLPASLAPGKRPRSTLSPSMAFKDGKPYLAFGTPGGDQQDQWSLLMFLHHVHHGMNLQEAIDCPAFHTEHMPSSFYPRAAQPGVVALESRFPEATRESLAQRGHRVRVGEPWSEGRLSGCAREETPQGRILKAGANPRGMQGYAIGR